MKKLSIPTLILLLVAGCGCGNFSKKDNADRGRSETLTLDEISIRDPCILPDASSGAYYLYSSGSGPNGRCGVVAYKSSDLVNWEKPVSVLEVPADIWANPAQGIWAPEVHFYNGKYYAFVTLHNDKKSLGTQIEGVSPQLMMRGTQIFVSDSPEGPFVPFDAGKAATPADWMALDGTLWMEEGIPYMIFCHEWVQMVDGTMDYVELASDLSAPAGEPRLMFRASDAPWVRPISEHGGRVTDGCYLYRSDNGKLIMIWSSFSDSGYAVGTARSVSGKLEGPWTQDSDLIFSANGGHAMIFKTFDGKLMLTLHQPNDGSTPHAKLFELEDTGDGLRIKK